jgi:hypothetical protein
MPDGPAAPAGDVAAITETLRAMANCNRPQSGCDILSFYTDDYFRRPDISFDADGRPVANVGALDQVLGSDESQVMAVKDARQLPDGRIGVFFATQGDYGPFVIFAKQGSHWLIDELYQVAPSLQGMG